MAERLVQAVVRFADTSDGGRTDAARSGYRAVFQFDGSLPDIGGEIQFDGEPIPPGEGRSVVLRIWAGEHLPGSLNGVAFRIREGHRIVARGIAVG